MTLDLLTRACGLAALLLNVAALLHTCERRLRLHSGLAGALWALNNLLLGAHTAAALSLVSAGRTATSAVTLQASQRLRLGSFVGFAALTLGAGFVTWHGWLSLPIVVASVLSTFAMFYLQGPRLRWAMVLVSALWMVNAWAFGSAEQAVANLATAGAALWGGRRLAAQGDASLR